jgi:hypothetical protein
MQLEGQIRRIGTTVSAIALCCAFLAVSACSDNGGTANPAQPCEQLRALSEQFPYPDYSPLDSATNRNMRTTFDGFGDFYESLAEFAHGSIKQDAQVLSSHYRAKAELFPENDELLTTDVASLLDLDDDVATASGRVDAWLATECPGLA